MRFKILVFVLASALLAGTFLAAYWFYDTVDRTERVAVDKLNRRIREVATQPAPDPAATSFARAMEAVAAGEVDSAHDQLTRLLKVYPSSPRVPEVQRILGEINLDRLFSRSPMPGKRDYIVKPGDSLARIEKGSLTTIPFLMQINNLPGLGLQPGDRLVYQPLEFEVEVDASRSSLTVRRMAAAGLEPEFFKKYALTAVVLPPNFPKTLKTQIQEKAAWLDGGKISVTDPKYTFARKRLTTTSRPGRAGLVLQSESERPRPSAAPAAPDAAATATATASPPPSAVSTGVFLDDADMEELTTILRVGTPVVVRR